MSRKHLSSVCAAVLATVGLLGCEEVLDDSQLPGAEISGNIETDTTWSASSCPLVVIGDVYVEGPSSPTLTIEAGCTVRFRQGYGLYVSYYGAPGGLRIEGTAADPVRFVPESPTGSWAGIGIYDQAIDSELQLEHLEMSRGGGNFLMGQLQVNDAVVTVKSSTFDDGEEYGIYLDDEASFSSASTGVTVSDTTLFAVSAAANGAITLPVAGSSYAGTAGGVQVRASTLTRSGTLGAIPQAYTFSGDVYVDGPASPVLTFAPGVTIEFGGGFGLYAGYYGQPAGVMAVGTATAPITFHGVANGAGSWAGIGVYDSAIDASTRFEHVVIDGGGGNFLQANLQLNDATIVVKDALISGSAEHGIMMNEAARLAAGSGNLTVTGNTLFGVHAMATNAGSVPGDASFYAGNGAGGVAIAGGTLRASATWQALDVPWVVTQDAYVDGVGATAVLTIEAGATLGFAQDYGLYIGYQSGPAALYAVGTSTSKITFSSSVASPSRGEWSGIGFYDSSVDGQSRLDFVRITHGGGNFLQANLHLSQALPQLGAVELESSEEYGLYLQCSTTGQSVTTSGVVYGTGGASNQLGNFDSDGC